MFSVTGYNDFSSNVLYKGYLLLKTNDFYVRKLTK